MVCGPSEERSRVVAPPPVSTAIGVPARARRFAAACRRIAAGTAAVLLGVVLAQPVAAQSRTSLTASPQGAVPQGVGAQERRIAMVVGNARYRRLPLANPENDARLIASRLRDLGFDVREHLNLASRDFRRLLREFTRQVQETPGVVVFYYAGHGVQIDGRNYLLPIDVNLGNEDEIKDDSVDIDDLFVSRLESAKAQTRIVILDACRDNPFANRTRTIRAAGGLAEMAARGTLIAYASAPGATAEDGPGGSNSVYTRHLAEQMMVEGAEVEQMFKRVRVRVLQDTKDRQVPWVNTSLTTNFSFKPRIGPDPAEVARQAQLQRLEAELERTRQLLDQARLRVEQADAIALAASRTGSAPGGPSAAPPVSTGIGAAVPTRPVAAAAGPAPTDPVPVAAAAPLPAVPTPAAPSLPGPSSPAAVAAAAPPATLPRVDTEAPRREFTRLQEQLRLAEAAVREVRASSRSAGGRDGSKPPEAIAEAVAPQGPVRSRADECAELLTRMSIGEMLGAEAETFLHQECKR